MKSKTAYGLAKELEVHPSNILRQCQKLGYKKKQGKKGKGYYQLNKRQVERIKKRLGQGKRNDL
jgi:hypothetical protein